jgi:hypothetical protein
MRKAIIITVIALVGIAAGGCERTPHQYEWFFKRLSEQGQ